MIDYTGGTGKMYHVGIDANDIGKYVILPGDPGKVDIIASFLDDAKFVARNREYTTYTGYLLGEKVSVVSTGMGGPSAAICIEELVRCGAHTFIRQGTCGGMDLNVKGGDLVIATASIRAEGTTREYAPIEFPAVANYDVVTALKDSASELDMPYHVGVVQSKDSFYGQHEPGIMPVSNELESKWDAWCKMGCLASEMESASLFIVGSFRKVRVGAIFLALANQERAKKGLSNDLASIVGQATSVTINAMKKLIERDRENN